MRVPSILIVDDERPIRALLEVVLRDAPAAGRALAEADQQPVSTHLARLGVAQRQHPRHCGPRRCHQATLPRLVRAGGTESVPDQDRAAAKIRQLTDVSASTLPQYSCDNGKIRCQVA